MTTTITDDECQMEKHLEPEEKSSCTDSEDDPLSSLSTSTSDSSNPCPFTPEIAGKLSAAFAKATGIDFDVAVDLLNVHGWNIDQALAATYEAKEQAESMIKTKENWKEGKENFFKTLSWNIDLSDEDDEDEESQELMQQKVETIVEILLREQPQVIFLQQVGTFALTLIITSLASLYHDESIQIDPPRNLNYISIFTRKSDTKKLNVSTLQYHQEWQMLKVEIMYQNSIYLDLFNAYLDENADEALSTFCFDHINQTSAEHLVISGISSCKISEQQWDQRPTALLDLWESIGKPSETATTYDPALNSNIDGNELGRRDDRLFFRSPTSKTSSIKPVYLEFEGVQRLKTAHNHYPSTHWAIQAYFDLHE